MVALLLTGLVLIGAAFLVAMIRAGSGFAVRGEAMLLGAVTSFFDALGIGSFAPSTAWIKLRALVPDSYIPATLNVGHALPSIAQALIFITLVEVDPVLLVGCIACAVAGALIGAPIVQRLPLQRLQAIVGTALLIAAILFAASNLKLLPAGGTATALAPPLMLTAFAIHFVLGGLMTAGIGLYAPSLVLLSLMGLNPKAVFPIMMGACAFLMPSAGFRFLKTDRIDHRVVMGMAVAGIPAVIVAAYVVKELPLEVLRWGVVGIVLYTALIMLRAAFMKNPPISG